jgi:tetrahydromethanopterin S-methyltransferase subunit H
MIKEKWGIPTASAPSNGSYMDLNRFKDMWGFKGWSATDSALEAISAFMFHDMIFSGPMAGATRILPAVAEAEALLATVAFTETQQLPKDPNHPLFKLFPDFVEMLKSSLD